MGKQTQSKHNGEANACSLLLKNLCEGILAEDRRGRITYVNPAAENLTGLRARDLIGRSLRKILKLIQGDNSTMLVIPSIRSFHQNRTPRSMGHWILAAANNKEVVVDVVSSPIIGPRGAIDGTVLALRDVSNRVLEERTKLEREKIGAIGNMAASMAKDFAECLGNISGYASIVVDSVIPQTRPHEEAKHILQAVNQYNDGIVRRLMSIARASNSQSDTQIEDIPLGDVVANAVQVMQETISSRNIIFTVKNPDNMPYVIADKIQMFDNLLSLFTNSVDAMPRGGNILIDYAEKHRGADKGFVVLRVRDTGTGMTKEVLRQAFDPFFSTKDKGSGIGLGLTAVKSSVAQCGGMVKIRSHPGHGTSVRIFLRKSVAQPKKSYDKRSSGGETILVVDDDKHLLSDITQYLRASGYQVHSAINCNQALTLFKKHFDTIDLSLIDLIMPGLDGRAVLASIMDLDPSARIVIMSGFSKEHVRSCVEHGVWEYIQKPFDRDLCLSVIRQVLDKQISLGTKKSG